MNLRQQIVQSNIDNISSAFGVESDESMLRLSHALYTDQSIHSFDSNDIVEGGQDKQIDTISIFEQGDEAYVYILQIKNKISFESNVIIQLKNGLNWIFNKPRNDITTLGNTNFKDKILEYRTIQNTLGPSNIHVRVAYIIKASDCNVSDECKQEEKTIIDEYDNETFASFQFEYWSANEIVDRINSIEKKNKKIDVDIKIRYDTNTPSLIKYYNQGLAGIICTATASEISRIVNDDPNGYIFDLNIRKYLGNRGNVNSDIMATCSSNDTSYLFWFLNNGITIVCDKLDPVTDPDDPHIKIKNIQIVNGCQTASSLARAAREGILKKDSRVLLRIYETNDTDLVDKIILTTNNQNKISGRNLRANDSKQTDLEKGFSMYELHYERKPRQYDNEPSISNDTILANDIVATSYLAVVLKKCSDSRSRKYKVWSEFYDRIFGGGLVEPYIIATLIYQKVKDCLNQDQYSRHSDEKLRYIAKNASFHISRVATYIWRQSDEWKDQSILKNNIKDLASNNIDIDKLTKESFGFIGVLAKDATDLNGLLKASHLDTDITKRLYNN